MSAKPAKDSTNQGWFVEYGAVAAPLPVIMLASLSFLHLKTSTYDLQIRSPGFIMGVNFFSRERGLARCIKRDTVTFR